MHHHSQYLRLRSAVQSRVKPFLTQPHTMATLLHEIGHALYEPIVSEEEANVAAKMRIFGDMLEDFASGLDAQSPEAYRKHVLQPEIDAHRFALRTILHWRAQGLDLEPDLSREQLLQKMAQQLSTYAESGGIDDARKLLEETGHWRNYVKKFLTCVLSALQSPSFAAVFATAAGF